MRLHGYVRGSQIIVELSEASFATDDAETVQRLGEFFLRVADQMREHGDRFGHEHLKDFDPRFELFDVTVVRPD